VSGPALSLPPGGRAILRGPDAVARALAAADRDPERRWLLRRPQAVRRAFVDEVVDAGAGSDVAQRRWMLRQDAALRASFVAEVLRVTDPPDREAIWLLGQDDAICASYVAEVLDGGTQGIGMPRSS
jgi:hypothetical protein